MAGLDGVRTQTQGKHRLKPAHPQGSCGRAAWFRFLLDRDEASGCVRFRLDPRPIDSDDETANGLAVHVSSHLKADV